MKSLENIAHTVSEIMGPQSAAAQALRELDALRAEGKQAWLEHRGDTWVVGSIDPNQRKTCPECLGEGSVVDTLENIDHCPECGGHGYVLTDEDDPGGSRDEAS